MNSLLPLLPGTLPRKTDVIRTRWSPLALRLFYWCFRPVMRWRLAGVYLAGAPDGLPEGTAVLLVANHVSWWDGFLLREVHRRCAPKAPLYTLMLEEQRARFPFFRWMGAVGIRPGVPASLLKAVRFLKAARQRNPSLWLSFFPQGRILPSWRRPLDFQPGFRLFARVLEPVVILPVGIHLEMLNTPAPSAFISIGDPLPWAEGQAAMDQVEACVLQEVERIYALLHTHGEDAPRHWPGVRL